MRHARSVPTTLVITSLALALGACSSTEPEASESAAATNSASAASWPRVIEHDAGSTTIDAEPMVIVSTSISLTGSILAIDAPLVASAATTVGALTDDKGFFTQWATVADERGVEVLYPNLELDMEAIETFEPDLIIGSTVGGDSTLEAYDQLSEIAPTILLDYGSKPWTDLTTTLGEATGLEDNAAAVLADSDGYLAKEASEVSAPKVTRRSSPIKEPTVSGCSLARARKAMCSASWGSR